MPITLVQSNSSGLNSTTPTTVAFLSNTTAKNLLVVSFLVNGVITGFSDTGGNTFISTSIAAGGWTQAFYYCLSALGGAESVTVSGGASVAMVTVAEFNAGAGNSFTGADGAIVGNSGDSSSASAGPIVTTNATDLILGIGESAQPPTAPGSGFTQIGHIGFAAGEYGISEYRVVSSTGSYSVTATPNAVATWSIAGLALKAVASAKGAAPFPWYVVELPH